MNYVVPTDKIIKYLLANPKKRGFFVPLGYTIANWMRLHDDLIDLAARFPHTLRQTTIYGTEIEIIGSVVAPNGRTIRIRTGWILPANDTGHLRFLTAYPA